MKSVVRLGGGIEPGCPARGTAVEVELGLLEAPVGEPEDRRGGVLDLDAGCGGLPDLAGFRVDDSRLDLHQLRDLVAQALEGGGVVLPRLREAGDAVEGPGE